MAELYIMSEEQKQIWSDWVAERPETIKALCTRFHPNRLYKHKVTGQKVIPCAFFEDNTVEVLIPRRLNDGLFPTKKVFGVEPDNLEEMDLPSGMNVMSFDDYMIFTD